MLDRVMKTASKTQSSPFRSSPRLVPHSTSSSLPVPVERSIFSGRSDAAHHESSDEPSESDPESRAELGVAEGGKKDASQKVSSASDRDEERTKTLGEATYSDPSSLKLFRA